MYDHYYYIVLLLLLIIMKRQRACMTVQRNDACAKVPKSTRFYPIGVYIATAKRYYLKEHRTSMYRRILVQNRICEAKDMERREGPIEGG